VSQRLHLHFDIFRTAYDQVVGISYHTKKGAKSALDLFRC
jgi:hypothetical protein